MDKNHRAVEYETIRKEMTDRLLLVYGLLPAAATAIAAYLTLVTSNMPPEQLLYATLPPILIVCAFCFTTYSLLCNIYNSGSYLIVYHELGFEHQYLLRSRFLAPLARRASNTPKPKIEVRLTDTAPTLGVSYFFILGFGITLLLVRFEWSSLKLDTPTIIVISLIVIAVGIFLFLLFKLLRVKSTMESDLLQYMLSRQIVDTNFIFEELDRRYQRILIRPAADAQPADEHAEQPNDS